MSDFVANNQSKGKIYLMSITALMTAVTSVIAPMSFPIGVVPVSFTNFAIYLSVYLLGWKMGTVSYILYILIGAMGLPVFSGFSGGLGKLFGPTGGYIIGFIPMAIIAGLVVEKYENRILQFTAMVVGTCISYVIATAWFCVVMNSGVAAALGICVLPFIPGDIAKMVIAITGGSTLRNRLKKTGYIS